MLILLLARSLPGRGAKRNPAFAGTTGKGGTSRCDGVGRGAPRRAAARGFTLIEVLLATVLLAAGLALAFATLGGATRAAARGEAIAAHNDHMRSVENFLRARLTGARPLSFHTDEDTLLPQRFVGEPERMRFVADLPNYLGRGGPYLHELAIVDDGEHVRLQLSLEMVLAGETVPEDPPRPPEPLARDLREARFRYRGADPDGGLADWQERWEATEQLPLLVEISLTDADGRAWPPLVVFLPLGNGAVGAGLGF